MIHLTVSVHFNLESVVYQCSQVGLFRALIPLDVPPGTITYGLAAVYLTTFALPDRELADVNLTPSPSALTISGPPKIIDQFLATNGLEDKKQVRIPIYGPYHAGHLHEEYDFEPLLQGVSTTILESHKARIPVSSTSNVEVFSAGTLKGLLRDVTDDILLHPLRWDYVLESVISAVKASGNAHCSIVRFGPSTAGHSLVSALRQEKGLDIELDDRYLNESDIPDEHRPSSNGAAPSKIAICGLSGT